MKKTKRILAIIGVILLLGLYITTLVLALTEAPGAGNLFMTSVVATVIVPILIWIYTAIFKWMKRNKDQSNDSKAD